MSVQFVGPYIKAIKPNWPESGLSGAWITHTFLPGRDLLESVRQAEMWADEKRTTVPTYYVTRETRPKYL